MDTNKCSGQQRSTNHKMDTNKCAGQPRSIKPKLDTHKCSGQPRSTKPKLDTNKCSVQPRSAKPKLNTNKCSGKKIQSTWYWPHHPLSADWFIKIRGWNHIPTTFTTEPVFPTNFSVTHQPKCDMYMQEMLTSGIYLQRCTELWPVSVIIWLKFKTC